MILCEYIFSVVILKNALLLLALIYLMIMHKGTKLYITSTLFGSIAVIVSIRKTIILLASAGHLIYTPYSFVSILYCVTATSLSSSYLYFGMKQRMAGKPRERNETFTERFQLQWNNERYASILDLPTHIMLKLQIS